MGGEGQEGSLVRNSQTKGDPSDPVYGPQRKSKDRHAEDFGGPLGSPVYTAQVGRAAAIKHDRLVTISTKMHLRVRDRKK